VFAVSEGLVSWEHFYVIRSILARVNAVMYKELQFDVLLQNLPAIASGLEIRYRHLKAVYAKGLLRQVREFADRGDPLPQHAYLEEALQTSYTALEEQLQYLMKCQR
jgi:hypothetical protein